MRLWNRRSSRIYILNVRFVRRLFIPTAVFTALVIALAVYLPWRSLSTFLIGEAPRRHVIVIDPGHGGIDGGTSRGALLEKDLNLDISLRLKDVLTRKGFTIYLTREIDTSLELLGPSISSRHKRDLWARTNIANYIEGDAFISIHMNYASETWRKGPIVFYTKGSDESKMLAERILKELEQTVGRSYEGVLPRRLHVLENAKMPSVLVEVAFLSNYEDALRLESVTFRQSVAEAIGRALDSFRVYR